MEYNVNDFNLEQVKLEAKLNLANEELRRVLEAKDIINKATMDTMAKLSSEKYNEKIMKKIITNNNNAIQRASGCMGFKSDYNLSTETNNLPYEVNLSIEGLGDIFKNIWEFILKIIKTIWNAITGFFKAIYNFFFGTKKSVGSSTSGNSSATPANTDKVNNMINNIANGNNVNATPKDIAALPKVEEKLKNFLEKDDHRNRIFISLIMEDGMIDIKKYFLNQCDQFSNYIDVLQKKINIINSFCKKYIDTYLGKSDGYNADVLFNEFKLERGKMLEGFDGIDFGFTDLIKKSKINRFDYSTNNVGYNEFIKKNTITYIKSLDKDKITYNNIYRLEETSIPFGRNKVTVATKAIELIKDKDLRDAVYDNFEYRQHEFDFEPLSNNIDLFVDDTSKYREFINKHCDKRNMINLVDLKNYKNAEIMMDELTNKVKEVTKKITDVKGYGVDGMESLDKVYSKSMSVLVNLLANINSNNVQTKCEHLYFLMATSELLANSYLKYVGDGTKNKSSNFDFDNSKVSFKTKSTSGNLIDISKIFVNFSSKMNIFIKDYIEFATDVYKIVDGKVLPTRAAQQQAQQQTQTVQSQVQQTNP